MNSALAERPIVVSSLLDRFSVSIMFRATPTSDCCRWYSNKIPSRTARPAFARSPDRGSRTVMSKSFGGSTAVRNSYSFRFAFNRGWIRYFLNHCNIPSSLRAFLKRKACAMPANRSVPMLKSCSKRSGNSSSFSRISREAAVSALSCRYLKRSASKRSAAIDMSS